MIKLTKTTKQTKKLGKELAEKILKRRPGKRARVLGLVGDLGGGKTIFLQGFGKGLGIKQKILSPTFILMRKFQIPNAHCPHTAHRSHRAKFQTFYHIDCYRIKKAKEILDLGFKEIVSNPRNIVAIEWAKRIKKIMPKDTIWINFEFVNEKTRKIVLSLKHG